MEPSSVPFPLAASAVATAFVGSLVAAGDAAMGALPPGRLAALAQSETGPAKRHLQRYVEAPSRVLGRWLVARILASCTTAVLVAEIPAVRASDLRAFVAIAASILVCAILWELSSAVARARAPTLGPKLLRLLRPFEIVVVPIADPLSWLGRALGDALQTEAAPQAEARLAEAEVEHVVEDAEKSGELGAEPAEMIRNVLDFKDLLARDVMVPRIKVSGIEESTPMEQVLEVVKDETHSRYPVYKTKIDNVVGILHIKDLLRVLGAQKPRKTLAELIRPPVFIPETQPVSQVLRDMRSRRHHMAVLIDEYGGVSGIVTLEDILEQIVGEIRDEHDPDEAPVQDLGGGRLLADASVSLADLSAYLGTEIEGQGDYGSLGGLLTHVAGRVPEVGEKVSIGGMEFLVRESDAKRIIKVEIVLETPRASIEPSSRPDA